LDSPVWLPIAELFLRTILGWRFLISGLSGAPRPYGRGTSPNASSGGTLRSTPSFAKATEGTHLAFIHGLTPVAFCEGG